jgi:hypothetical protein
MAREKLGFFFGDLSVIGAPGASDSSGGATFSSEARMNSMTWRISQIKKPLLNQ